MENAASVAQVNVALESLVYLQNLLNAGLLVGPRKKQRINPKLKPIADALYHVLAGGKVDIKVTKAGNAATVAAYQQSADATMRAINEINQQALVPIVAMI
jgi:hypothetical protein